MASVNTTTTLSGLFKELYGTSVIDLCKFNSKLARKIKFSEAEAIGNLFHQPVDVQLEHAFTAAASGTTPTLLTVNTGQLKDAQVQGSQLVGRSAVDYEAIAKSMNGDKAAFVQATKHIVRRLSNSATKRLECMLLHGQKGLATISSVSGSSTTRAWVITDASWAAGIWAGTVGATLDVYTSGGSKRNTNAVVTITSVTPSTKTINVSGNATDLGNIVATDVLFWETHSASTEFAGLDAITRNSGSLFGIDAATYELWGGNTYSTSTGVISMPKILDAIALTASYGGSQDVCAVVSPKGFEVLNSDLAALRQYDGSYQAANGENGYEALRYHSQVGAVEIMSHPFQKDGMCHIFVPEETKRIGAGDLSFIRRHGSNEALILESSTTASAEMRVYSHQALFIECPRHTVVLDGITY